MSLVTPKSIVITTLTHRAGRNTMTGFQLATPNHIAMEEGESGQPRKRRRLTHLTPEERMMRRKLKNRVAAQTARDRKKAKMDVMEVNITDLQDENKRLLAENNALRQQSLNLVNENQELKERLGQATKGVVIKKETESESAEGTDSGSFSIDDALRCLSANSESDEFFKLLDSITYQGGAELCGDADRPGKEKFSTTENTSPGAVVGATTAELDSINELIHFDHVYYKPPVSDPQPLPAVNAAQAPPIITIQDDVSGADALPSDILFPEAPVSPSAKINLSDLDDLEALLHQDLLSADNDKSADIPSIQPRAGLKRKLSDSDIESLYVSQADIGLKVPPQLTGSLSDSGYSDVASPRSDVSSVGSSAEEDMWEESFTELFPSLL